MFIQATCTWAKSMYLQQQKLNLVTSRAFRAHESRVTKCDHRAQCTEGKNRSYRLSSFSNSCSKETKFIATIFFREEIIPSFDFFCKFIHFSGPWLWLSYCMYDVYFIILFDNCLFNWLVGMISVCISNNLDLILQL